MAATLKPPIHPPLSRFWSGDRGYLGMITLATLWLFRLSLIKSFRFIGNSDRLNTSLNVLKFYAESLQRGKITAWNPSMLGGFNGLALPYTSVTPLAWLEAWLSSLSPRFDLYYIAGLGACALLIMSGFAAYYFIHDVCGSRASAWVGACLYQYNALSTLKISQDDMSFAPLILAPLLLLTLRKLNRSSAAGCFLILCFLFSILLTFTFLQTGAYVVGLTAAYAAYRSFVWKKWLPALVTYAALAVAILFSYPRIHDVGAEMALTQRHAPGMRSQDFESLYEFQNIRPREILRWFDDGVFGRYPSETVQLGNNLNLTEGMLLYSTVFAALLVLFGLWRCRHTWLGWKEADFREGKFFLTVTVGTIAVVCIKPVEQLVYDLFGRVDFTHARVIIAGVLPCFTLVSIVLASLSRSIASTRHPLPCIFFGGFIGAMLVLPSHALLEKPVGLSTVATAQPIAAWPLTALSIAFPRIFAYPLVAPSDFRAYRTAANRIELYFRPSPTVEHYRLEFETTDRGFISSSLIDSDQDHHVIDGLPPSAPMRFRIATCLHARCSKPTAYLAVSAGVSPLPEDVKARSPQATRSGAQMRPESLRAMLYGTLVLVALILVIARGPRRYPGVAACALIALHVLVVLDALSSADFRLNGAHIRGSDIAFEGGNSLLASADDFVPPTPAEIAKLAARVETRDFRSVTLCDPKRFPAFCAPHLAQFWNLRLLDGYTSGVPIALAGFPWPTGVLDLRSVTFTPKDTLPWAILGLLNVKYAIVVDSGLYRNRGTDNLRILANPTAVMPRQFFARATQAVATSGEAVAAIFQNPSQATQTRNVADRSFFEGPTELQGVFDDTGEIHASYAEDRAEFDFPASDRRRFLVVNERFHPRWKAEIAGVPAPVFRANADMWSVIIPPDVTQVRFRFIPFMLSAQAAWFYFGGVLIAALFAAFLRHSAKGTIE